MQALKSVGVIDYGLGNLTSVAGAIRKVGHEAVVTGDTQKLWQCDCLILPGVGAFGDGIRNLRQRGFDTELTKMVIEHGMPILGICLGSQLMTRGSDEFGWHDGLDWIAAHVRRLEPDDGNLRVPHVGWNDLIHKGKNDLLAELPETILLYFVHSYFIEAENPSIVIGECDYGGIFVGAYQVGNIYGTQFHPEKSQGHGLTILKNFIERS